MATKQRRSFTITCTSLIAIVLMQTLVCHADEDASTTRSSVTKLNVSADRSSSTRTAIQTSVEQQANEAGHQHRLEGLALPTGVRDVVNEEQLFDLSAVDSSLTLHATDSANTINTTGDASSDAPTTSSSSSVASRLERLTRLDITPNDPSQAAESEPTQYELPLFGYYFRASGMAVEPQTDARLLVGGGEVASNTGYGITVAGGYRFPTLPISIELEYAYRRFETDNYLDPGSGLLGENQFSLHTLTINALLDVPEVIGPVGFYAGGGIGVRISEFRFESTGGMSETGVQGDGFFWQAMAGVTATLGRRVQAYGGVRWADGGRIEDDALRLDTESFNIEFGVRLFF